MAKRRADDFVLLHPPSKRLCRSLRLVDVQRGNAFPAAGVNAPSLLVVPAGRPRKRTFCLEDQTQEEEPVAWKITRASPGWMERTSDCGAPSETWPREDCTRLDTNSPKIRAKVSHATIRGLRVEVITHGSPRQSSRRYWRWPLGGTGEPWDTGVLSKASKVHQKQLFS